MGVCISTDNADPNKKKEDKQNRKNTKEINKYMMKEQRNDMRTVKILFLGPGGSGKSTIFKQLKNLHCGGFSRKEARSLRCEIYSQIISQMKTAITHYYKGNMDENEEIENNDDLILLNKHICTMNEYNDLLHLTPEIKQSIEYIWKNCKPIQDVFKRNDIAKKVLDETTPYFWDNLDRISADDFVPNEHDIINMRFRTTGMLEMKFQIKSTMFWFVDVGGQKNERRKWIQHFDEVNAVIFVVDLSSFNELMFEDQKTNCMEDAFKLFEKTLKIDTFQETPFIIFLNKTDLFKKKITSLPITLCPKFDDFEDVKYSNIGNNAGAGVVVGGGGGSGGQYEDTVNDDDNDDDDDEINRNPYDFDQTTSYIQQKFKECNNFVNNAKQLYIHFTCAMDRNSVDSVFHSVQKIVLSSLLASHGTYKQMQ